MVSILMLLTSSSKLSDVNSDKGTKYLSLFLSKGKLIVRDSCGDIIKVIM
jgi:hypothetical protein